MKFQRKVKKWTGVLLAGILVLQCAMPVYAEEISNNGAAAVGTEEGTIPETTPADGSQDGIDAGSAESDANTPDSTPSENQGSQTNQGDQTDLEGQVNQGDQTNPDGQTNPADPTVPSDPTIQDNQETIQNPDVTVGAKEQEDAKKQEEADKQKKEAAKAAALKAAEQVKIGVSYSTHVQSFGWMDAVTDGSIAGTTGKAKRMEAIRIQLTGLEEMQKSAAQASEAQAETEAQTEEQTEAKAQAESIAEQLTGSIEYRAHSQSVGWQDWVKDGELAGTVGRAKRLEAICIRLTGTLAEKYDVYYKVHSAKFGDLGWAKNGETAGSEGYARSIEAITIQLVEKGSKDAPAQTSRSFYSPTELGAVTYSSHVQSYGWMGAVADGKQSGTTGKKKRMEAIKIYVSNPTGDSGSPLEGSVTYRAHSQSYGWMDWVQEGAVAGTEGKAKRLEAIQIKLTGELEQQYDIYYKVHCSSWGDLGWAKNGEVSGTTGSARAIEAIEIRLVKKGSTDAPSSDKAASITGENIGTFTYDTWVEGVGWKGTVTSPAEAGTTGQKKKIEAFKIQRSQGNDVFGGGITYRAYMQGSGWQDWKSDGQEAGSTTDGKRVEAFQVKLTGALAEYCTVYYRAHVEKYGWLGWAKNGQTAGTNNCDYRIESIQVAVVLKTAAAPGSTSGYYQDTVYKPRYNNAINTIIGQAGSDLYSCYSWIVNNLSYQTLPIPMDPPAGYSREEGYAIYAVENRRGNCFCYAAAFAGVAKKLGYQARYIEGSVGMARGGTGPHGWVEVDINGSTYVCDPDGEAELKTNFYMVTYGSARLQYYK